MTRWMRGVLAAGAGSVVAGALWGGGGAAGPAAIASAAVLTGVLGWMWPAKSHRREMEADEIVRAAAAQPGRDALASIRTAAGESLADLTDRRPALLVFVRHSGCCFCREAIADLAAARPHLVQAGIGIVLIHRSSDLRMKRLLARYRLVNVAVVRDPAGRLYRAFGLGRAAASEIAGPATWARGLQAAVLERHGVALPDTDPLQMPGVFVVHRSRILARFYHRSAADRPDYRAVCASGLRALHQAG